MIKQKKSIKHHPGLLIFIAVGLNFLTTNAQIWPSGVHDPSSMIKDGANYWVFATGDGIYSKYSTNMVTWSDGPTPFAKGEFPAWILKYASTSTDSFTGFFWAPDIIFMNNQYYLYYSCSVWGTRNSCIGLVTNKTLDLNNPDYNWVDQGDIGIYSPDFSAGGSGWDVNAIDPSVTRGPDGKIWMVYGSFNVGGIMVTQIDSVTGKPLGTRTSIANSWTGGTNYGEGEGSCMFYRDGYFYLVYNKGGCCNGIASTYYMVIGRSKNPQGPYIDKKGIKLRAVNAASGGSVFFKHDNLRGEDDRYYGPGHFGIYRENGVDYISFHYYSPNGYYPSAEANYKGGPTLGLALLKWGTDGWPVLSFDFVDEGLYSITNVNSGKAMDIQNHAANNKAFIWQYTADSTIKTQKWFFRSLGTGEYTIQNYADLDLYLEHYTGIVPRMTSDYKEKVNQKFRLVKDIDDNIILYPSAKDEIFEVPNAATQDYQVKLHLNTNHACQRWNLARHTVNFSATHQNTELNFNDTSFSNISIATNGLWSIRFEDANWLEAFPASGDGNALVTIHASNNLSGDIRYNKIFIRSHGGQTDTVLVAQSNIPSSVTQPAGLVNVDPFPNPTKGTVKINSPQKATVNVYSLMGTLLFYEEIDFNNDDIDISNLKPGLYLFEITTNNNSIRKIVKKE